MAVTNAVHFDLDLSDYAVTMDRDNCCNTFMDQYLLATGSLAADLFPTSSDTFDENTAYDSTMFCTPEHYSFGHGSVGSSSTADNAIGDNGCALLSYTTPGPNHRLSPSASPSQPPQQSPLPQDNPTKRLPRPSSSKNEQPKPRSRKTQKKRKKRTGAMERNRVAASKSRLKSKSAMDELESVCNELEEKHSILKAEQASILQETLRLKSEILRHAGCGDSNIDIWVSDEARSFVKQAGR